MSKFIISLNIDDEQSESQQAATICRSLQNLQQDLAKWRAPITIKELYDHKGKVNGLVRIEDEEVDWPGLG